MSGVLPQHTTCHPPRKRGSIAAAMHVADYSRVSGIPTPLSRDDSEVGGRPPCAEIAHVSTFCFPPRLPTNRPFTHSFPARSTFGGIDAGASLRRHPWLLQPQGLALGVLIQPGAGLAYTPQKSSRPAPRMRCGCAASSSRTSMLSPPA